MQYMVVICVFLCVVLTAGKDIVVDPCVNHKFIEKADFRGQQCHVYDVGSALCDRLPINSKEWFAAKRTGVYLEMPMICPTPYACGTAAPIWLNDTHPNSTEGIVEREFCVRGIYSAECCKKSIPARIKNCGSFFVYELATTECDSAYCFGNHKCPVPNYGNSVTKPSASLLSNDPCILAKPIPKASLRGTQCPVYEVKTPICDRLITPGWYSVKVENKDVDMPTSCITAGTCGTSSPIWLNGSLPRTPYEIVRRKACIASFLPGECCKKSYDVMVKNCVSHNVYYLPYTDSCDEAFCFGSNHCIYPKNSAEVSDGMSPKNIAMYTGIATIICLLILIVVILIWRFYCRIGSLRKVNAMKNDNKQHTEPVRDNGPPPPPYKA